MPSEGSDKPTPWNSVFENLEKLKAEGRLIYVPLMHGFFFRRLYYLRGFTNLMRDFIAKPPYLYDLIERLIEYILNLVNILLKFSKIDVIYFWRRFGDTNQNAHKPNGI